MKCKTFKSYADFPVTLEKGKAEGEDGDTVKVDGSRMFRGRSPSRNIHVVQLKQLSNDRSWNLKLTLIHFFKQCSEHCFPSFSGNHVRNTRKCLKTWWGKFNPSTLLLGRGQNPQFSNGIGCTPTFVFQLGSVHPLEFPDHVRSDAWNSNSLQHSFQRISKPSRWWTHMNFQIMFGPFPRFSKHNLSQTNQIALAFPFFLPSY